MTTMLWFRLCAAALLVAGATADQSTGSSGSSTAAASTTTASTPTGTSSASAVTHTVLVGQDTQFKFSPDTVNASVGDSITWVFYPGGHTVVRASFGWPCIPWNMSTDLPGFFYSGEIAPQTVVDPLPQYTIQINDTAPIFYYCSAPGSCINQHMLGVINPNSTETFEDQLSSAESTSAVQLSPGQPWPSETANPFTTTSAPAATAPTQTPSSSSPASSGSDSSSSSLSPGAIAGIAIGGAAVVILAAALIYICGRHGGQVSAFRHTSRSYTPPAVEEARFGSGPKSPGQETFASSRYQRSPGHGGFYPSEGSPSGSQYVGSPPPMSPGSHPAYGVFPGQGNQVHSPLMGTSDDGRGYYDQAPQETPPPPTQAHEIAQPEVAELASSSDPGNSPIPGYQPPLRQLSWAAGAESSYRPGSKT
jgi:plastocyanin